MCYKLILCKVVIKNKYFYLLFFFLQICLETELKKIDRVAIQSETMIAAVNEVLKGRPLNVVPREFNINRMTLKRCCRKKKFNLNESF